MAKKDNFYYKSNRFQQLRGFYHTVQLGSVSKASQKMGLQQCSVSIQIQSLERDLNTELFTRNGPRMEITEKGKILYKTISEHVEAIDTLPQLFEDKLKKDLSSKLEIAANHASMHYLIPSLLKSCKKTFPDLNIKVFMKNRNEALTLLKTGDIQAFIGTIDHLPEEFESHTIGIFDVILIAHKQHPLIVNENFALSDISHYETVKTLDSNFITVPFFEDIIKQYNVGIYAEIENIDWEILKSFVRTTETFTIVSSLCYDPKHDYNIGTRSLKDFIPSMPYGIITKKGAFITPPLQELINVEKTSI